MDRYYHSVTLDKDKCVGCTNCLKRCPTEAIRVRGGRAHIIDERCIDCGECIRVCEHHAKIANTNPLSAINGFPYKIALPAPSLYGQFKNLRSISDVIEGLKMMGFDAVYEVARGADIVSVAVMPFMRTSTTTGRSMSWISSTWATRTRSSTVALVPRFVGSA